MTAYSNTIIYKICCKNKTIKDLYIGHTTNFLQRKKQHKNCLKKNRNSKLYNFIRENGGWENWEMIEIAKYNCKDVKDARVKELEYFMKMNPSLNSCIPCNYRSFLNNNSNNENLKSEFLCECGVKYICHKDLLEHNKKCSIINNNSPKEENNFIKNNIYTENAGSIKNLTDVIVAQNQYINDIIKNLEENYRHINSHNVAMGGNAKQIICIFCQKKFKHTSSMYRHKKICQNIKNEENVLIGKNDSSEKLIEYLISENKELKKMILGLKMYAINFSEVANYNCI